MRKVENILVFVFIVIFSLTTKAQQDYTISLLPFNTEEYDEISPVYHKGNIVFSSNRKSSIFISYVDDKDNLPLYDIYTVEESNDDWGKPEVLAKTFKTHFNEGPATFNGRGSEIYFSRNINSEKKFGNSIDRDNRLGIYYSKYSRRNRSWSKPTPFQYNNSEFNFTHPSMSEDDQHLYFVSDMDGGYGGTDIYVCEKTEDSWGEPQNLGPNINTEGDEYFPFIHSSGRLYFSSDEHGSIGRLDIFYSEKVNGEWHKPIHMDPPVNSRYNDYGLIIDAFKKTGMFCSDRQRKSDDIYSFAPLYPMFENSKRQEETDYCYVLYEAGAQNPDSMMYAYEWKFGDGKKQRGIEVEHCYNGPGDYTLELNVIDKLTGDVFYTQATYELKVEDVEQVYINAPDTIEVGQEVFFDGRKTNIKDFKVYRYYWDLGDGRKTRGVETRHIYTSIGNYIVQLGVVSKKDRDGNTQKRGVYKNIVVVGKLRGR